jgi:hypothetical protein
MWHCKACGYIFQAERPTHCFRCGSGSLDYNLAAQGAWHLQMVADAYGETVERAFGMPPSSASHSGSWDDE